MKNNLLLKIVATYGLPLIFLYGAYVLFHGKVSPGGGFQGGAIWASGLILHSMVFGVAETKKIISVKLLQFLACFGVLIYCGYGLLMALLGGRFLEYNILLTSTHQSQFLGVMVIEIGVHITVFAILSLIYWRLVRE